MSKYLIGLIVFLALSLVGGFFFLTELKALALPFIGWLVIENFTAMLAALQWKHWNDARHPGKTDALYAKFLGVPIAEFEALSDGVKAQLTTDIQALKKKYGVILKE